MANLVEFAVLLTTAFLLITGGALACVLTAEAIVGMFSPSPNGLDPIDADESAEPVDAMVIRHLRK